MSEDDEMQLDALIRALGHMEESYDFSKKAKDESNERKYEIYRNSVIQTFEYNYVLALALIKKYIRKYSPSTNFDMLTYKEVLREALKVGVISSFEDWLSYRESRNKTSHAYSDKIASEVYGEVENFIKEIRFVIAKLEATK